jgi:hypothetical protein
MKRKPRIRLACEIMKFLILLVKLIKEIMTLVGGATNYASCWRISTANSFLQTGGRSLFRPLRGVSLVPKRISEF